MMSFARSCLAAVVALVCVFSSTQAVAQSDRGLDARKQAVVDFWTSERRANAIPRDLVIDERGLGYLKHPDGSLQPYGHQVAALAKTPMAKPGGGTDDTDPPEFGAMSPADNATIGSSQTFSAVVTDASGVKSVSFNVRKGEGLVQSFAGNFVGNDTWTISLSGFSDGQWSWWADAKDNAGRGGNSGTSTPRGFTVDTSGGGGSGGSGGSGGTGDVVTNAHWTSGGAVQNAAGRVYFQMPANSKWKGPWNGYVCSGTVATDGTSGRSVIITAAHCVYDDANKAFAANVLFIPNQDGTTASGTNRSCTDDPFGCWVPSFGVVDVNWTTRTFPNNIPWDYAYYVVDDSGTGSHLGAGSNGALDVIAGSLSVQFTDPATGAVTHALGYSYSDDPNFMYCKEGMDTEGSYNWWLASCQLSGGSSGGPWVQPMTNGSGPIISVNSWGYTTSDGMAGPFLNGTSASCLFSKAKSEAMINGPDGEAGYKVTYSATSCSSVSGN